MTSVEFIQKALIGSTPERLNPRDDVPWLRAEDFTNPLGGAIWRHLESGHRWPIVGGLGEVDG